MRILALLLLSVTLFALQDSAGTQHSREQWSKHRGVVLIFLTTDCPVTNKYAPEMQRLKAEFAEHDILMFGVHSDPTQKADVVAKYAAEYGYTFPILLDPKLSLAREFGATRMPEAVLLDPRGKVVYRGRIDDRYKSWGKGSPNPSRRDLKTAVESFVAGTKVEVKGPAPVGCFIPFGVLEKGA